jgi:EmrB/QacA subfamily drug resistance transporter
MIRNANPCEESKLTKMVSFPGAVKPDTSNPELKSPDDLSLNSPPVFSGTEKGIVLLIAVLAGFLTPFDGAAVNIALPTIASEFHMDVIALSWIATAYLLAAALFLVPFGKIADIYGRKKIFLYGIGIFAAASLAMTMVPSTNMMVILRVVQGLGSGMIFGTTVAIISSVFPPGERGKALGIYITSVYFGLSLGPFLGGVLTQYFGWRSIFFVNVPLGIICILLVTWKLKGDWADCRGERFDLTGSVIYGIAIVAVMYGLSVATEGAGYTLLLVGVVAGILFVLYEQRTAFPVLDMKLFTGNRAFAFSNIAALINYSATFAVTFLLSLDLQFTKGFTPEHAGIILMVQPAMQAIVSPIAGKLSDRIEPAIVASAGMALTAAGLILLIFFTETSSLWYLIVCLVVLGVGFGLFSSPNTNAIMSSVEKRNYGVASGMVGTMRLLGQMLSMGIAMLLFAIMIGPVEITPAYYPQFQASLHIGLILFAISCVVGVFFSLVRGRVSETP